MRKTRQKTILDACSRALDIDLTKRCRIRKYVYGRFVYMHYTQRFTGITLHRIGKECNLGHCNVLHGLRSFDYLIYDIEFAKIHDKCATAINRTRKFKRIKHLLPEKVLNSREKEYVYSKNKVKQVILKSFLSNGITKDIMEMTPEELNEMIKYKVKPHILLRRKLKQTS